MEVMFDEGDSLRVVASGWSRVGVTERFRSTGGRKK